MSLILGGENGTAWSENSWYGVLRDPSPNDHSFLVGRTRADRLEPPMPSVRIGDTVTFDLGYDWDGIPRFRERYDMARDYIEMTGDHIITDTNQDGTPWFTNYSDDNMLVRCIPGRDSRFIRSYWGVIVGGSDNTRQVFSDVVVSLDVFILASLDEYGSESAIRRELER